MTRIFGGPPSIRAYLVLLVMVAVLPLTGLLLRSRVEAYRSELAMANVQAERLAEVTSASTMQLLADARGTLAGAARRRTQLFGDRDVCRRVLRETMDVAPYLINILVTDAGGDVLCSVRDIPDGVDVSTTDRDWFLAVRNGAGFTVGAPVMGRITGGWVVGLAVPILGPDGEFVGSLASSLPLVRFQELLAGVRIRDDELVTIANEDRVILARSQDPAEHVGTPLPTDTLPSSPVGPGRSFAGGTDLEGIERSWANVAVPEMGWRVFAGVPTERVRGPAQAALWQDAALGLLVLVLTAFILWRVQRLITRPLGALVDSTRAAGLGDSPRATLTGPAEIRALASQLNETFEARARAERAERTAKERYRSILDQAVFGIATLDEDGRFLQANPTMAAMMGFASPDALTAVTVPQLCEREECWTRIRGRLDESGLARDLESRWRRRDDSCITVRVNGRRIIDDDGVVRYQIMAEDITGQKELEKALRHSQKMEAVGRLAGGIAHDFNNLLTVVSGNTELLLGSLETDDAGHDELGEIRMATARATGLTRQLLAFSRKTPEARQSVEVNALLERLEAILSRLIGGDIAVRTEYGEVDSTVWADPCQLEQAIVNICVNARDAMPGGGTLSISTRWVEEADEPSVRRHPFGWVRVRIEDTGVGMPPEVRERVFEPFFTTKPSGEGTGLGLATTYANIDAMDGQLTVRSQEGEGTRFDIRLPAEAAGDASGPDAPVPEDRASGTETVMVVEDESAVRRFVAKTLESAGYTVLTAEDGEDAWTLFRDTGGIDLVLTDVVMPRLSGTELAQRIRAASPDTPLLFMSGYTADLPVGESMGGDADLLVQKPFTIPELLGRVRRVLDREMVAG